MLIYFVQPELDFFNNLDYIIMNNYDLNLFNDYMMMKK